MSWYNYIQTGPNAQLEVNHIPVVKQGRSKVIKVRRVL